MKTIITVIFAGILTYTGAQNPGCSVPNGLQAMGRNFDINKFFSGQWYVTHMKDVTPNSYDAVCREYKTYLKDGLVKIDADGDYQLRTRKLLSYNCSTGTPPMPHGSIHLQCSHADKNGNAVNFIFFSLLWTIIQTRLSRLCLKPIDVQGTTMDRFIKGNLSVTTGGLKTTDTSKATDSLNKHRLQLADFKKLC
uniref:Salivary lipocalin 2 n=1 Tax=Triatoma brasiliensis TaxID=65344 RepID=Q0MTD0_TRIBS|nr:salivary lipocalin 2 [Triatoma brasiliensis]